MIRKWKKAKDEGVPHVADIVAGESKNEKVGDRTYQKCVNA